MSGVCPLTASAAAYLGFGGATCIVLDDTEISVLGSVGTGQGPAMGAFYGMGLIVSEGRARDQTGKFDFGAAGASVGPVSGEGSHSWGTGADNQPVHTVQGSLVLGIGGGYITGTSTPGASGL